MNSQQDSQTFHEAWQKLHRFHPRRLVYWTLHKASKPYAGWWLMVISFIEAIFFPIPPDVLLIPLGLSQPRKLPILVVGAALFCALGGVVSWYLGRFAFETVGVEILSFFNISDAVTDAIIQYNKYGASIIVLGAFTPVPYKLIAMVAGLSNVSLGLFFVYALLGRLLRFSLIGLLLYFAGNQIRWLILRHFGWLSLASFVFLIGLYFLFQYVYTLR